MKLFLGSMTQMNYAMFSPVGFSYPGVLAAAEGLGIEMTPELFERFQLAESTYLKVLAENAPREH
jgi:hypothetical protein